MNPVIYQNVSSGKTDEYGVYIGFYSRIIPTAESWWPAGEFEIVSTTEGIVKSSSSNKIKPILFPAGGYSISYVKTVVSQNRVGLR